MFCGLAKNADKNNETFADPKTKIFVSSSKPV